MRYYLPVGKCYESKESSRFSRRHPATRVPLPLVQGSKAAARWGFVATRVVDQLSVTPPLSGNSCLLRCLLLLQPGQLDNRAVCCSFCQGLVETLQFHLWSVTENSGGGSECRGNP